jgi:hypothetical protein
MTHCYFTCGSGKAVMRRRPVCAAGRVLAIEAAAPHTPNRRSQVTMLRLPPGCGDEPQPAWLAREQHGRRLRGDWPSGRCRAAESPRLGARRQHQPSGPRPRTSGRDRCREPRRRDRPRSTGSPRPARPSPTDAVRRRGRTTASRSHQAHLARTTLRRRRN